MNQPVPSERARRATLVGLVVVGAALRVQRPGDAQPEPVADFRAHLDNALLVADDGPWAYLLRPTAYRMPLYPVVLGVAAAYYRNLTWLRLVNVGLSTALIPLIVQLGRRLGLTSRASLVAGGIVAMSPTSVMFAPLFAPDHLFLVLVCLALLAALPVARAGMWWRVGWIAVLLALATLSRGEALFYLPVVAAVLQVTLRRRTRLWRRERLLRGAGVVVATMALLTPWYVHNRVLVGHGAGLSTMVGVSAYFGHNGQAYGQRSVDTTPLAGLGELERHRRGIDLAWQYVRERPHRALVSAVLGSRELYAVPHYLRVATDPASLEGRGRVGLLDRAVTVAGWTWRAFVVIAAASLLVRRGWTREAAGVSAGLIAMNWLCHAVLFYGQARHRMAAEVGMALAAGVTLGGQRPQPAPAVPDQGYATVDEAITRTGEIVVPAEPPRSAPAPEREPAAPEDDWLPVARAEPEVEPASSDTDELSIPEVLDQPPEADHSVPNSPPDQAVTQADAEPEPEPVVIVIPRHRASAPAPAPLPADDDAEVVIPRHRRV